MSKLDEKLKRCLKEGEHGIKHKGLRKIKPNKEISINHLKKADHNYKAMIFFYKNGFSDWSASAAFYTLYHCLLGILAKNGYESRNQSCTFALIENLILTGKVKEISADDLKEIFDFNAESNLESDKILDVREDMQYSAETILKDEAYTKLKEKTTFLFNKLRLELQRD